MPGAKNFFSKEDKAAIVKAIGEAENRTSGEIRVHVEERSGGDAYTRAVSVFEQLNMHNTELRNGVLFYLAVKDHQFTILGDKGINDVVPEDFWEEIKEVMQANFRNHEFTKGLCTGISMAGKALKEHFPVQEDDKNELPDDISWKHD